MVKSEQTPGIRLRMTLSRRLDIAARHAAPATFTILLMLLVELPLGFADQAALLPSVTLCSVFFWSVFRPSSLPPPVVFLIGLLLDLLGYLPVGLGPVILLLAHGLVLRWRSVLARQGFLSVWGCLAAFAIGASLLEWACMMALRFGLLPTSPALFQALLTISLYPALAMLFIRAHRTVADPERV